MSIDGQQEPSTRRVNDRALWIIGLFLLLLALAAFVYFSYRFNWTWTGFPGRKLFDYLQILVAASIPVAVGSGTFALTRAAKKREERAQKEQKTREEAAQKEQKTREEAIAIRREEEAALQAYLDRISQMWLELGLQDATLDYNISTVARAHTLTVLGRLEDGERKRSVLQFLYEAGLINKVWS